MTIKFTFPELHSFIELLPERSILPQFCTPIDGRYEEGEQDLRHLHILLTYVLQLPYPQVNWLCRKE